jgi:hypothetical protein
MSETGNDQRITARELRIGNWIEWDDESHDQVQVETISTPQDEDGEHFINGGLIGDFKAIPITDEWLKRSDMSSGDVFWANFSQDSQGFFLWVSGYKVYLKYVHHLQNLYFALTGEELTIKETAS